MNKKTQIYKKWNGLTGILNLSCHKLFLFLDLETCFLW